MILPGMSSILAGVGLTGRLISSTSSPSGNHITCPTVQAGDIAVFVQIAANQSSVPSLVTPSGFTNVNNFSTTSFADEYRFAGHFKIMAGTEGGTTLTGMSGNEDSRISLLVVRLSSRPSSATSFSGNINLTTGDPSVQTISVSGITKPTFMVGYANNSSGTFPTGATGTLVTNGATVQAGISGHSFYYEVQSGPTSRTIDGSGTALQSFGLALNF